MNLIISVLIWFGVVVSPSQVNEDSLRSNSELTSRYSNDTKFVTLYEKHNGNMGIVMTELAEGD
jgi:hypothetical protein